MAASSTVAATSAAATSAISALLKWKESQPDNQKIQLIPEDEFIYLILTLKKIPAKPRTNAHKIALPHPVHTSPEICLIIDDRANAKPGPETVKQIIRAQNIPIAKLIKLSKLKTNYKPYEAKRKLCDSYDLFLADKRIVHFLPKLLGGTFFKKKKIPVPVDMSKNWKGKVEKAGCFGLLYFRTGTCCVMKVGKVAMEKAEIEENVREAIQRVVEFVPKKWGGVRSFHLKFADSVALPVYQALPDMKLKIEGVREEAGEGEEVEKGESLTGDGSGSERKSPGKKKKEKGRIHEVQYMDVGLMDEEFGGEDSDGEIEAEAIDDEGEKSGGDEFGGKKRKKGVVEDEVNLNEGDGVGVKKAKKGKRVKSQVVTPMDVEKPAKKGGKKEENVEAVKEKKLKSESVTKKEKRTSVAKKTEKMEAVEPKEVTNESTKKSPTKKSPTKKSATKKSATKKSPTKEGTTLTKERRSKRVKA